MFSETDKIQCMGKKKRKEVDWKKHKNVEKKVL